MGFYSGDIHFGKKLVLSLSQEEDFKIDQPSDRQNDTPFPPFVKVRHSPGRNREDFVQFLWSN